MSVAPPPESTQLPDGFLETVGVTPERQGDLELFRLRLAAANREMNLVGDSTLGQFWRRHVVDSAQLLWFSPGSLVWADLGSGAGLPGLVLAILLKGRPGACVHLVESMAKRVRFLSEMVGVLDLPAVLHHARAETLRIPVEVVTARACAPLPRLLGYAEPFFARGARGLFLKGAEVDNEIVEARKLWRFRSRSMVSVSDPRGRVLSIEELGRATSR